VTYDFNGGRARPTVIDSGLGGESLVQNYCQMLSPDNNRETQAFAMQSLDSIIEEAIK
jgi:hypothetical protein